MKKSFSLEGWELWTYLKGRRRALVALVAAGIIYVVSDEELAAIIGGLIVESLFAIGDYYFQK